MDVSIPSLNPALNGRLVMERQVLNGQMKSSMTVPKAVPKPEIFHDRTLSCTVQPVPKTVPFGSKADVGRQRFPDSVRIYCAVSVSRNLKFSVGRVFEWPNFEFEPDFAEHERTFEH